jgi:hypothetical protein
LTWSVAALAVSWGLRQRQVIQSAEARLELPDVVVDGGREAA